MTGVDAAYSFPDVIGLSEHGQKSLADVNSRLLKENMPVIKDLLDKGKSNIVSGEGIIWDFNYLKREQTFLTEVITKDPLSKSDENAINNSFKRCEPILHPEYGMAKSLLGVSELNYKDQNHREAIGRSLVFIEHALDTPNFRDTKEFKTAIDYLNKQYGENNVKKFLQTYNNKTGKQYQQSMNKKAFKIYLYQTIIPIIFLAVIFI